mmetsp:Transcript_31593/g.77453  ORF Transcript_31593/g.77453 Transcript_31593/m.77453 type:complete len:166 (-) Transcript_31593:264-761(-)
MPKILQICCSHTSEALQKRAACDAHWGAPAGDLGHLCAGIADTAKETSGLGGQGCQDLGTAQFGALFGIGHDRFENILSKWRWWPKCNAAGKYNDPSDHWRPVRYFQDMFNIHMHKIYHPALVLCADESTTKWVGLEGWHSEGCLHITKIPRKPENVARTWRGSC